MITIEDAQGHEIVTTIQLGIIHTETGITMKKDMTIGKLRLLNGLDLIFIFIL